MIDHSSCDHERTPKARAACRRQQGTTPTKQRPERPPEATYEAPTSRRTRTRLPDVTDVLKASSDTPARVRTFLNVALTRGMRVQPNQVERGTSFHVLSEVGAITVTWDGKEVGWFARYGFSSLSRRIKFEQVWDALEKAHPKTYNPQGND